MALIPGSRYSGQTDTDAAYPQGKARNAGSYQDGTGTPLEKDWVNDIWGFLQALLAYAAITPSGDPDEVGASQYMQAVQYVEAAASERAVLGSWTDVAAVFTELQLNVKWIDHLELFVTVGNDGTAFTSPDAHVWTLRDPDLVTRLSGLAASASLGIVAVGDSGGVTHSTDAVTWAAQTSGVADNLQAAALHGSLFIAVGDAGTIITSPNGTAWTERTSGVAVQLIDVASNGAIAVAVGATGTILTSPDGITWTARTSGVAVTLGGVVWNGSLFVVNGSSGTILTSPDGITWTARTSGVASALFGFGLTDNYVLAVGASDVLLASRDGITWAQMHHGLTTFGARAIAWNGTVAVAVGDTTNLTRSGARLPL
jgi:hypothetical protein